MAQDKPVRELLVRVSMIVTAPKHWSSLQEADLDMSQLEGHTFALGGFEVEITDVVSVEDNELP